MLERWRAWTSESPYQRIVGAVVIVGLPTLLVRLVTLGRELVIARQFGVGDAMDAFFLAYMLPAFAVAVIGGSLNAALIPTYLAVKTRKGDVAAQRLFSSVTLWSTLLLLGMTGLLALTVPWLFPILGSSFSEEKLTLTRHLFFLLLPLIALTGLSTTWSAVLNAGERFAIAAAIPAVTPLATIGVVLLANQLWGVRGIVFGSVGGAVIELALLAFVLKRNGISVAQGWRPLDADTRSVLRQYGPMTAGSLLMGSTLLIDSSMAATLGSGAVSSLNYGQRIITFVVNLGGIAIGTAALPYFSQMTVRGEWSEIEKTLKSFLKLIFVVTVPLVVVLWVAADPLVRVFFQSGAFTRSDTEVVANVQSFFALQIPFFLSGVIMVRVVAALRANVVLMWVSAANCVANVALNYAFMVWLGVKGIALSTSIVYMLSFTLLALAIRARLRRGADPWDRAELAAPVVATAPSD